MVFAQQNQVLQWCVNDYVAEHTSELGVNRAAWRRLAECGRDGDHPAAQACTASAKNVPALQFFNPMLVAHGLRAVEPDAVA